MWCTLIVFVWNAVFSVSPFPQTFYHTVLWYQGPEELRLVMQYIAQILCHNCVQTIIGLTSLLSQISLLLNEKYEAGLRVLGSPPCSEGRFGGDTRSRQRTDWCRRSVKSFFKTPKNVPGLLAFSSSAFWLCAVTDHVHYACITISLQQSNR